MSHTHAPQGPYAVAACIGFRLIAKSSGYSGLRSNSLGLGSGLTSAMPQPRT